MQFSGLVILPLYSGLPRAEQVGYVFRSISVNFVLQHFVSDSQTNLDFCVLGACVYSHS